MLDLKTDSGFIANSNPIRIALDNLSRVSTMIQQTLARRFLAVCGVLVVIYSVFVLGVVVTTSDLRIRWLISDPQDETPSTHGVRFWLIDGFEYKGAKPQDGDLLLRLARRPVTSYLDLSERMLGLYQPPSHPGSSDFLPAGTDPSEISSAMSLPPLVEIDAGPRMVEIVYQSARERDATGAPRIHTTWVALQSLPLREVLPTFIWFMLQLGILAIAGIAYWNRPFDRSAQVFYVMCMCSTGAFIGGFHWWLIGGSAVLNLPFIVMAMALPAVMLHFFLVYPRPRKLFTRSKAFGLAVVYTPPVLGTLAILVVVWYLRRLHSIPLESRPVAHLWDTLELLTDGISMYLFLTGAYFVATLVLLWGAFRGSRNRFERLQLRGMLLAGLFASIPIAYSIYVARFDQIGFVKGAARMPMFWAVVLFQLAFVIGIFRYKMLLAEQFVSRGAMYYTSSAALLLFLACTIALGAVSALHLRISLSMYQNAAVVAILIIAILLLFWIRDRLQQGIDRRFYQEKYQLDKAFQRMNRAVMKFTDVEALAEMMFGICRDVVGVQHLGLMQLSGDAGSRKFSLVASTPGAFVPDKIQVGQEFLSSLSQSGMLQRVPSGARHEMSSPQATLRQLNAHLVHALENESGIQGLLILGEKPNGSPYSAEDMAFLQTMCQITSVALQSIRAQREMFHLNQEMQMKLDRLSEQKRQIALLQAELDSLQDDLNVRATRSPEAPDEVFYRGQLKGESAAMQNVLQLVRKVAQSPSAVLIRGESGTGKELLAEVLHENSPRRGGPLVKVHCAALAPSLLESELFGHVRGAFTGATEDKIGRFQAADGGTIFLDEIGDISPDTQVKLLRVLQNRSFEPVGSNRTIEVDVRLVAATHQDLERLITEGKFREDLYYRLNVIALTLPPLRDRPEDIAELAVHFLNRAAKRIGRNSLRLSDDALRVLEGYTWPGNVRQLENVIERASVFSDEDIIRAHDLSKEIHAQQNSGLAGVANASERVEPTGERDYASVGARLGARDDNDDDERRQILDALARCGGNKARAARLLGLPRSTYYSKLQKYLNE